MKRLEAFHHRAVRYTTGNHIKKHIDGSWEYPNHSELEQDCGLFPIDIYRRGTLRKYLEAERSTLLQEAMDTVAPSNNANKIL